MPSTLTYPGVYIEEVPSGVHTITGVATSIAAFIGYTPRGPVNQPVHIFNFGDYETAFGGLSVDSVLSYSVKQFFQNGGSEAYVVRVAHQAVEAGVTIENVNGAASLTATAATPGLWGNGLQIDVDFATTNPFDLFNLTVSEYAIQGGVPTLVTTEVFRNLSMYANAPTGTEAIVNAGSQLIQLTSHAPANAGVGGFSQSVKGVDPQAVGPGQNRISVMVDGDGPWDIDIIRGANAAATVAGIANAINAVAGAGRVNAAYVGGATQQITITTTDISHASSVQVYDASANNAAGILKLGLANGGVEQSGWAPYRPRQTGTVAESPDVTLTAAAAGHVSVQVYSGAAAAPLQSIDVQLFDVASAPTSVAELATVMNNALQHTSMSAPRLVGATVTLVNGQLRISPGSGDPNASFLFANQGADTTADDLGLIAHGGGNPIVVDRNVARYAPGAGVTAFAQVQGAGGSDGTAPNSAELTGDEAAKTGIYALAGVDLFNLLVMPDLAGPESDANYGVLDEAIAYCERRRAMMIIDVPSTIGTFAQAQTWVFGSKSGQLRSRNAALYFPRIQESDPLQGGIINTFPAAGAIAGVYARTDATRGVWKAPAGTDAMIAGASGLTYKLTDGENGALNPVALNALRTFPVIGTVVWGARTARGADVLADDYKYVPVRRLALFLEESLYRGSQWAVFEPNDEPLWAQLRLNLGAFMHGLYAQGAFEGSTPKDAYFVKCDSSTTTQNDIDLGRVNIVVGFAPLKPAEFVVIQIQQIAGAIQT